MAERSEGHVDVFDEPYFRPPVALPLSLVAEQAEPDEAGVWEELAANVPAEDILCRLPPRQQQCARSMIATNNVTRTAEALGVSRMAVGKLWSRARRRMQAELAARSAFALATATVTPPVAAGPMGEDIGREAPRMTSAQAGDQGRHGAARDYLAMNTAFMSPTTWHPTEVRVGGKNAGALSPQVGKADRFWVQTVESDHPFRVHFGRLDRVGVPVLPGRIFSSDMPIAVRQGLIFRPMDDAEFSVLVIVKVPAVC